LSPFHFARVVAKAATEFGEYDFLCTRLTGPPQMKVLLPLPLGFRAYNFVTISASLATVFMLRAVPVFAAGMRNLESAMPSP
jgi:hypothetical protein